MSKIASVTFTGDSGSKYKFDVYPWGTDFYPLGAVYVVTRRHKKGTSYIHAKIYTGETGDLSERFDNHHKFNCFEAHKANCICIYAEQSKRLRRAIESDLLDDYNPPCND